MNIDKYKQCLNPEQISGVVHEKDNLAKILATQEKIQSNSCKTIAFSSPIITYNETGIIFPNTINIIQGKKGVHKSRLTEIFCGLMLQRDITQSSHRFLGMKRNAMQKSVVLYVDTERNINDQFPYAIQKSSYFQAIL
jgi:predicted ATPase